MKLTLPKPPALNALYATNKWGAKYLTAKGQTWKDEVMWKLKREKLENWAVPVRMTIDLYTCRRQDIDSIWKITMDTFEDAGVFVNDYWVFEIHGYKHKCSTREERVDVEIEMIS